MVFSSWVFIFVFLPVVWLAYFGLNRWRQVRLGKLWLVAASLFFYAYWNWKHLPLIVLSIALNYGMGRWLAASHPRNSDRDVSERRRKWYLGAAIALNLGALAYYKYANFLLANLAVPLGVHLQVDPIVLPLAISFFTFTQIVYLVDSFRGETQGYNALDYALFVTFFPHLIAGPIVQHSQIMPQFQSRWTWLPREGHLVKGLFLFAIGLFKKVVIADAFAVFADAGFEGTAGLNIYEAWATSLSYTFQLYFDFSGYCDMAMGVSLLFNIWLPINFNSPYRSLSIQDFWRRWHITLGQFLRDHVYIPLGGNRAGALRTDVHLLVTFTLGGLWHGASWMFVVWGVLHGVALVLHRHWQQLGIRMPKLIAWALTFLFVNFTWVFFRASDWASAQRVLTGMLDLRSAGFVAWTDIPTDSLAWAGWLGDYLLRALPGHLVGQLPVLLMVSLAFPLVLRRNAIEIVSGGVSSRALAASVFLLVVALFATLTSTSTVFLYFNF